MTDKPIINPLETYNREFFRYVPQAIRTESKPSFDRHADFFVSRDPYESLTHRVACLATQWLTRGFEKIWPSDRNPHFVRNTRLLHAFIGLHTELAELSTPESTLNVNEELGDVYWYLAVAYDELCWGGCLVATRYEEGLLAKITGQFHHTGHAEVTSRLVTEAGWGLDRLKKWMFYGLKRGQLPDLVWKEQAEAVCRMVNLHHLECVARGFDPVQVMETNLAKLRARYPQKFTTEEAHDRDLSREAASMFNRN